MTKQPRPLYLTDDFVKGIQLDASAIKIIAQEKADSWIPISRISRVIILGSINLSSDALACLMQNGVPISFSNPQGAYAGIAVGECQNPHALNADLQEFFSYEQGRASLQEWFDIQEMRQLARLRKRFHLHKSLRTAPQIQQQLNQQISVKYHFRQWPEAQQKLMPMLAAHQALILQQYGYHPSLMIPDSRASDLLSQLMRLTQWEWWQLAARGHLPTNTQRKQLAYYYQQHQSTIEQRTLHWAGQLWKRMNDHYYE